MLRYLPIFAVIGLMVYCFIDVVLADRGSVRAMSKPAWLAVVLLPIIGAILWLVLGRPLRARGAGPSASASRPVAPDDDPDFLRKLDERAWRAKRDAERAEKEQENGEPPAE